LPVPLYDIGAPDFADRCYDAYRRMRDEQPLYCDPQGRFFAVTRYEDVRAILNDARRFSNVGVSTAVRALPIVQQTDPPLHDELRALVTTAFTPRRVAAMEPRIRFFARDLLADFAERGECDFMADFARHLPSLVIGDMIGVPPERRLAILEWTESLVGIARNGEASVDEAVREIAAEFQRVIAARRSGRASARDDLLDALLVAEIDGGRRLGEPELLGFCFQLVLAGNDTTTNLIANAAVLLGRHHAQRELLLADPTRIPNAVEEVLRLESPTQVLPRRVVEDVVLHGRCVPAGSEVRLVYGAANRDERFFEAPERFDVLRPNAKRHLAFGQGLHFCLGAALARLEGRVALEELLARLPDYEIAGDAPWLRSAWARSHERVPLRFTPPRGDPCLRSGCHRAA